MEHFSEKTFESDFRVRPWVGKQVGVQVSITLEKFSEKLRRGFKSLGLKLAGDNRKIRKFRMSSNREVRRSRFRLQKEDK